MNLKKIFFSLCLVAFMLPCTYVLAQTTNGFVSGDIWYSKDPFIEGEKIKIYTAVFNGEDREFTGSVSFFDDTTLLGKKTFAVEPKDVQGVYIDWTVNAGKHSIYAKIENPQYLLSKNKNETVAIADNTTDKSERTVKKKIVTTPSAPLIAGEEALPTPHSQIENIANTIKDKTPDIVSEPIVKSVFATEAIRQRLEATTEAKTEKLQQEISILDQKGMVGLEDDGKVETKSRIAKPFKSMQLFFVNIFHFIFAHMSIFYMLSLALILYMGRYIISVFR